MHVIMQLKLYNLYAQKVMLNCISMQKFLHKK